MSHITTEIARQPSAWRRAALAAAGCGQLPRPGERVAVVGCGTSLYMAMAYADLRESAGLGETDAFPASEFPAGRRYDRYVVISRSGTTTEILTFLRGRTDAPTLALTAVPTMPIADHADSVLDLGFADEQSVVQTLFASTALTALRAHLGEGVAALADAADAALAEAIDPTWVEAEQFTFLGRGWALGVAQEAALKLREAANCWTEAYPTMEYRHGPISIAAPGRVVWHLGPGGEDLRAEVEATGATFVNHGDDPQVDLVRIQRLAVAVAGRRGLDPDHPRHLSRAVLLGS
ncbi:SIS domain-containing protein [Nocardioides panacihumi]|uniref:SIS domain-containing protein n=1 Tax=Nocardioides panacihumi TaxID=400774 RepID=A0ABN2RL56_9ACTN